MTPSASVLVIERRTPWRNLAVTAASALGLVVLMAYLFINLPAQSTIGYDAWSYWHVPHLGSDLYAGTNAANGLGPYRYSPAFLWLVRPLWGLDWPHFTFVWIAISVTTYLWLTGRWWLAASAAYVTLIEFSFGNIHYLLAAAIVLGFRYPAAWAFVLLTKVTPGVGLLWFAVRREWRSLASVLGATALVMAVGVGIDGPELWGSWLTSLASTPGAVGDNHIDLPLAVRLVAAAMLTVWGARRDARWVVPVAATLALPTIWFHGLALAIGGVIATLRLGRRSATQTA